MFARSLKFFMIFALAGCSGGGGAAPGTVRISPTAPSLATSSPTRPDATADFTITVPPSSAPASRRSPHYVSSATASVTIALVDVNGTAYTGSPAAITTSIAPNTSGMPQTYTISAPAVAGSDAYTIAARDAQSNLLSFATTTLNIVANSTNTGTAITLSGIVASVTIGLVPTSIREGSSSSVAVAVNAMDADGKLIVGSPTYLDANGDALTIVLADSDTSGATTLSPSSVTSTSTSVVLSYDGANVTAPTITPSISGGTITGSVTGATLTVLPPAPTLTALGQNAWVTESAATTFSQTLYGTNFTTSGTTLAISGQGVAASNVVVTSATTITATFSVAANAASGARNVTVTTPGGTTASLPLALDSGYIVTSNDDSAAGSPPGTGAGSPGDLRYALQNATSGEAIVFACATSTAPCTITLAAPLPPIETNLTIDGGGYATTHIDGASHYRPFFIDTGTVTIEDLTIQNAATTGGAGGSGGGGGLGAGAGIFINQPLANVSVAHVYFDTVAATGGAGSAATDGGDQGGGGGGLDFAGGGFSGPGAGGGGLLSAGADGLNDTHNDARGGGAGGGAFGGGAAQSATGGSAGIAYGSNSTPQNGGTTSGNPAGNGGNGGFGGGGGGGGLTSNNAGTGGNGGNGGFGGGGGSGANGLSGTLSSGGAGGPGGGAGASGVSQDGSSAGTPASPGPLTPTVHGGESQLDAGGGGAAAGPAIFVAYGVLTTEDSGVTMASAAGGSGATPHLDPNPEPNSEPGTADSTPVFNFAGTINGSTTAGPVAAALSTSQPTESIVRRGRSMQPH